MIDLVVKTESWPIRGSFTISRGSKAQVDVVVVELSDGAFKGHAECVPYARYNESCVSVMQQINSLRSNIASGLTTIELQFLLPAGAARNAIDCALWDLDAKKANTQASALAKISALKPLLTAYTLSLDSAEKMHSAAAKNSHRPLLKLKLAGKGDLERVQAVRDGAPNARLIVDANEGWNADIYQQLVPPLHALGVEMIEQPLPVGQDDILKNLEHPILICADESCHDRSSLVDIVGKYDMINIKLDKTGGLTEALALKQAAQDEGLQIMVGCMLATSLAMAPAFLVAQNTAIVDLDGPLLLDKDRQHAIHFENGNIHPAKPELWG